MRYDLFPFAAHFPPRRGNMTSFPLPLAAVLLCLLGISQARAATPVEDLPCSFCHGRLTLDHRHPPVVRDCLNCHERHFSPEPLSFNLQGAGNELCFACHDDPADTGGHPVAGHPVQGERDPLHPDRKFTCLSCHEPHQSTVPNLFRYSIAGGQGGEGIGRFCVLCHPEKSRQPRPEYLPVADPLRKRVKAVRR